MCQNEENLFLVSHIPFSCEKFLVWKFLDFSFLRRNDDTQLAEVIGRVLELRLLLAY